MNKSDMTNRNISHTLLVFDCSQLISTFIHRQGKRFCSKSF